jgi:hypothetical protein
MAVIIARTMDTDTAMVMATTITEVAAVQVTTTGTTLKRSLILV